MGVYIKGTTKEELEDWLYMNGVIWDSRDLIDVPEPHGRLIDEGSLTKYFNVYRYEEWTSEEVGGLINNAPTVIEESDTK